MRPLRFRIRTAEMPDADALRALIELSVRGLQKGDYSRRQIEGALGHALGLDTQLIEDGTYFVAEPEDGTAGEGRPEDATPHDKRRGIVGCGGWSRRRTLFGSDHGPNREMAFLDPASDAARIRAIFVHPAWARKGLGSLILQHCEAAAEAAGFRRLEMGSTLTGVPLYRLKGYEEQERVDVPLPNGEVLPVIRMTKKLPDAERAGASG